MAEFVFSWTNWNLLSVELVCTVHLKSDLRDLAHTKHSHHCKQHKAHIKGWYNAFQTSQGSCFPSIQAQCSLIFSQRKTTIVYGTNEPKTTFCQMWQLISEDFGTGMVLDRLLTNYGPSVVSCQASLTSFFYDLLWPLPLIGWKIILDTWHIIKNVHMLKPTNTNVTI